MDSYRDEYTINPETGRKIKVESQYTINPETGRKIKVGSQTWKRLAAKYYMIDGKFTYQTIPDSRANLSNKVFGMKLVTPTRQVTHRRVSDPKGERKYLIVGIKA